jgi:hypothetical protein
MANRKAVRPPTSNERLAKLPQFEPDHSISYHRVNFEKGERLIFPPERERQLRHALAGFIDAHLPVELHGKDTGEYRFIEKVLLAIATFEDRRRAEANFDRKAARETLKKTVDKILDTCQHFEQIATNSELSRFLRSIFASETTSVHQHSPSEGPDDEPSLQAALDQSGQMFQLYREISPRALADRLMRLEPILSLAAERVELQAGDSQRDEIAQELCDTLARAWIFGTGKIPTVSEPNKRSRSQSPFLMLLALVNSNIDQSFRHPTEFRNYAAKARDEMYRQFPELVKVRKPRGRK